MSADEIAQVHALTGKAELLLAKGHVVRAAEYYGRAAEVARALGDDNLVAVELQLRRGDSLLAYCVAPLKAPLEGVAFDPRIIAASRVEAISLLSGAVEALERRRVAGTLLGGKCTAIEEAWRADAIQRRSKQTTAIGAASLATLFGYSTFLFAASIAVDVLRSIHLFPAECSAGQLQSFARHATHAATLMEQPRLLGIPVSHESVRGCASRHCCCRECKRA